MKKVKLFLTVWLVGLIGGIVFWVLRLTKRIEVFGYKKDKFISKDKSLILISNHPSLWEPAILPFLLFPRFIFSRKQIPFSLMDKGYFKKKWFTVFRPVCIPIERGNRREELRTANKVEEMLKNKRTLIVYPECGRTFLGKEFRNSATHSGRIRKFPEGIRRLVGKGSVILTIWVEGSDEVIPNRGKGLFCFLPKIWKKTKIFIGQPFEFNEVVPVNSIVEFLENKLLETRLF